MKYLNNKIINIAVSACCCLMLFSCEEEEQIFEYKAIPKTEICARLVAGTESFAAIYTDTSYVLIPGVTATEIAYLSMHTGWAMRLFIFEVDLANPNVSIAASTPNNKPVFGLQQMTKQAAFADAEGHKVWGGVNGDWYSEDNGTPDGIVYKDGIAVKTTFAGASLLFAIMKDDKALIAGQDVYNSIRTDIREAICGHTWLVRDGAVVTQTNDEFEPRTWIGVSEDGLKVWMMVADGRNFYYSNGMQYWEMGEMMYAVGAHNSINLDGGRSSTFFIRNTPEFTDDRFVLRNWPPENIIEREVGNGLLIIEK